MKANVDKKIEEIAHLRYLTWAETVGEKDDDKLARPYVKLAQSFIKKTYKNRN